MGGRWAFAFASKFCPAGLGSRFVASVMLRIAQTVLGLAVTVFFARALGPAGYGIYAFALAVVTLLAVPVESGLATLVVREVARFQLQRDWGLLRGLLRRAAQFIVALTVIVVAVAAIVLDAAAGAPDNALTVTIVIALALVPLTAFGNVRAAALIGLGRAVQGQFPETLVRPGLLLAIGGGAAWFYDLTPGLAMGTHAVAALAAFAVGLAMLRAALPNSVYAIAPSYRTLEWAKSILPLSFLAATQMVFTQASVVLLGVLSTEAEVGFFRVATQGAVLVAFPVIALNAVIGPQVSQLFHASETARLQQLVTWGARVAAAAALPLALTFAYFGEPMLGLVFGQGYSQGAKTLAILCLGQGVNATMAPAFILLNMTGHETNTAWGMMVAAVASILFNLLLIPRLGMEGAAIATAISLSGLALFLHLRVLKLLAIDSCAVRLHRNGVPAQQSLNPDSSSLCGGTQRRGTLG